MTETFFLICFLAMLNDPRNPKQKEILKFQRQIFEIPNLNINQYHMQNLRKIYNPINTFVYLINRFKLNMLVLFCFIKAKEYLVQKQAHFFQALLSNRFKLLGYFFASLRSSSEAGPLFMNEVVHSVLFFGMVWLYYPAQQLSK